MNVPDDEIDIVLDHDIVSVTTSMKNPNDSNTDYCDNRNTNVTDDNIHVSSDNESENCIVNCMSDTKERDKNLKIGNLNIRSLVNKIDQLAVFVDDYQFDVICINETWLDDSLEDHEVLIPGYEIIRRDRNKYGGGVCFYIKKYLNFSIRNVGNAIESLWIELKFNRKTLIVGTIYRPPSSKQEYFDNLLNEIQRAKDISENVIVLGDLNYDYNKENCPILYIENLFDMKQLIDSPTRITLKTRSLLDVILTTDCEQHTDSLVIDIAVSDHCCVYTNYKLSNHICKQKHRQIHFRDYSKFNLVSFLDDLKSCQSIVSGEFDHSDLELRWDAFKDDYLNVCNKHAPFKTMRLKDRKNPWVTPEIIMKMYRRDYLKRLATRNKNIDIWKQYKELRNEITSEIKTGKKTYFKQK
jgi:hypothetical protein